MGQTVYILCALTSLGCTVLLTGRYRKTRVQLLFWSALAFLAFTITNVLLFVDLVLVPDVDLVIVRNAVTLGGVLILLYGLIHNNT
jgi:hydrogenase/urease accessory protein HupE